MKNSGSRKEVHVGYCEATLRYTPESREYDKTRW